MCPCPEAFVYASHQICLEAKARDSDGMFLFRLFTRPDEHFTNKGTSLGFVGLAAPHAGKILPLAVGEHVAVLVVNASYLASVGPVKQRRMVLQAAVHTEELPMTRIVAAGPAGAQVFVHAQGAIVETTLGAAESMHVSTTAIVALTEGMTVHLPAGAGPPVGGGGMVYHPAGGGPAASWAHKSQSVCVVRGPGTMYLASLPNPKFAARLLNSSRAMDLPLLRFLRVALVLSLFAVSLAILHSLNMLAFDDPGF